MKYCPNERCPHRNRTGRPGEYRDDVTACADCGTELAPGPAADAGTATLDLGPSSRLLISIAAIVAVVAARAWELPLGETAVKPLHLGLVPLLAAFLIVETAAALLPAWRPLRRQGRVRLRRMAWLMSVPVCVALAITGAREPTEGAVWVAAVVVLAVVAEVVRRLGLGDGYAVLIFATTLPDPARLDALAHTGGDGRVLAVVVLASVVAATLMVLRVHERSGGPRLPVCGILPLDVAALAVGLPLTLRTPAAEAFLPVNQSTSLLGAGVIAIAAAVALAVILGRGREAMGLAAVRSALFVAALFAAGGLLATVPMALPGVYGVALATAIGLDLGREWRARRAGKAWVKVATPASTAAAEAILDRLDKTGISVLTRGMAVRSLLRFAGPFVVLEIHVPDGDVPRAREICSSEV